MFATLGKLGLSPPLGGIDSLSRIPAWIISLTLGSMTASLGKSRGAPKFGGRRRGIHLPFSSSRRVKIGRISVDGILLAV